MRKNLSRTKPANLTILNKNPDNEQKDRWKDEESPLPA